MCRGKNICQHPSWGRRNTCIHFGPRYQIQYMYLLRARHKILLTNTRVCVRPRPPPCARARHPARAASLLHLPHGHGLRLPLLLLLHLHSCHLRQISHHRLLPRVLALEHRRPRCACLASRKQACTGITWGEAKILAVPPRRPNTDVFGRIHFSAKYNTKYMYSLGYPLVCTT